MNMKKIFEEEAGTHRKKIGTACIVIAVVMMLTVGIGLSQFKTAQVVKQNTAQPTQVEIPDPCPCHKKLKESTGIKYDGGDEQNYTPCSIIVDPVTGQEYTLREIYLEGRSHLEQYIVPFAEGCGAGASQSQSQSQQGYTDIREVGGIDFSIPVQPVGIDRGLTGELDDELTVEELMQRFAALDVWFAEDCGNNTPPPDFGDYGLMPGTWHLGPAMMVCTFVGLRGVALGFTAASMAAVSMFAKVCNFMITLAIFWEVGLSHGPEITQAYWDCIIFLTGGV